MILLHPSETGLFWYAGDCDFEMPTHGIRNKWHCGYVKSMGTRQIKVVVVNINYYYKV